LLSNLSFASVVSKHEKVLALTGIAPKNYPQTPRRLQEPQLQKGSERWNKLPCMYFFYGRSITA
jgi:hypothetical protein